MAKCIKSSCLGSCSVSEYSSSSSMVLQSNEDLRLPNGPLPVSSVHWPLPPTCNFAFISIRLFTILLILFHYLGQFHSVWLFRAHSLSFHFFFFLPWRFVGLSPNPQPAGTGYRIYNPGAGWPSYTSMHRVPILVAFYAMHGLQWHYSPVTTRRICQLNKRKLMWSL